ncbi:flavohemoprotein [Couchioplanes caeruleus]|uniref:flavohemoprotein n=1 Tax=Couchioplanes caeruleus TaxID=56438 RepID=UPI0020BDB745|nr:flavohemoprotein [Couchioplanes caeruleus]UQU62945.1 flavohemoprotein [Couchioplanes caeruleus]
MSAGSGSDPHMLALLRAMRLRLAAPDAAAAGAADVEAALTGQDAELPAGSQPIHPELMVHPHWPGPARPELEAAATEEQDGAEPGGLRASLGAVPGGSRPAIPPAPPPGPPTPPTTPPATGTGSAGTPPSVSRPIIDGPALPALPARPGEPAAGVPDPLPDDPLVPGRPGPRPGAGLPLPGTFPQAPATPVPPTPPGTTPPGTTPPGTTPPGTTPPGTTPPGTTPPGTTPPGTTPPGTTPPAPPGTSGPGTSPGMPPAPGAGLPAVPERRSAIPYPPGPGPWPAALPTASTQPVGGIPGIGGPRLVGPPWPGDPVAPLPGTGPVRPPVPGPPAPPVDGMDPADDAALVEVRRLLTNSLSLAGGPQEVAARLRSALMQAQPDLFARIPGGPAAQIEQLAEGLTWLAHSMDQPPVVVVGFGRLGAALAECGVAPQQLQLAGAALAEAMRAGMAANGWRQDFDQAWRSTWQHAYEWIVHGMTAAEYHPVTWTAVVVTHELRREDLAVIRLRPYLPMPYVPGQYARIEVPGLPGVWRPYSLAGAPRRDNVIELHVRAKTLTGVSGTLVHRTAVGDKVRISRAEGEMVLPDSGRDLLMIAGDTGVAPLKAMLTELAATADPRAVVLFWGARTLAELYDIEEITAIAAAARRATVVPVISEGPAGPYASGLVTDAVAAYGEWSGHEAYLAGPPLMLAATSAALQQLGVHPERIHHDRPE